MKPVPQRAAGWQDYAKSLPLYPLPHHAISRLTYTLTRLETRWFKNLFIRWFAQQYRINWTEAEFQRPQEYRHFNAFFTRALRKGARPVEGDDHAIISPADGRISQAGSIEAGQLFQAKGHRFTTTSLLGGDSQRAEPFDNGWFVTVYLSPRDYHRVHMPLAGKLRETVYIPGRLFSVAPHTTRIIPNLFARNERLAAIFDTQAGPMAMVLVGAINVAAIETVWSGLVTPPPRKSIEVTDMRSSDIQLARGAEMGRFNMGSTVILLVPGKQVELQDNLRADQPLRMGQTIGRVLTPATKRQ